MNSWDCFDTLIARRFYSPVSIFREVAARLGDPHFVSRRRTAERRSNKTYAGIYRHLPGIDPQVELDVELEHCLPIMQNMRLVQDGDMIVSDMYLDKSHIERMLRKAGLNKDVSIVVTPHGKGTGKIWSQIPKPDLHTGDNIHADVRSPIAAGIPAAHSTVSVFCRLEHLVSKSHFQLACWMRYVRLHNPHEPGLDSWYLWNDQMVNAAALAMFVKQLPDDEEYAFAFRDGLHLSRIYTAMTGKPAVEFHTSRNAYVWPTPAFAEYAYRTTEGRTIVDINGSGRHARQFFKDRCPPIRILAGSPGSVVGRGGNGSVERHNIAPFGTLAGIAKDGSFVRDKLEFPEEIPAVQGKAIDTSLDSIEWFNIPYDLRLLRHLVNNCMRWNKTTKIVNRYFTNRHRRIAVN